MTDTQPANNEPPAPVTTGPQSTQPPATKPEAAHDEQQADEQRDEAGRRPRPRIAADHDEGHYAAVPPGKEH